jgi:hypothetical protein
MASIATRKNFCNKDQKSRILNATTYIECQQKQECLQIEKVQKHIQGKSPVITKPFSTINRTALFYDLIFSQKVSPALMVFKSPAHQMIRKCA